MPREVITISVGQCGNQLAWRFWDLVLREHSAATGSAGVYEDCMSTFFRNWDESSGHNLRLNRAGAPVPIKSLRARAILVDTEEGVVSQLLRSPIGPLFDSSQQVTDVSGAGNNWAHGYFEYGARYHDALLDQVRKSLEACESPQSFFLMHSLGGGTGSGLGTYLIEQLADAFPELYRFTTALFPSDDDDVITSPYNFGLALGRLAEAADCILPIENQALSDIVRTIAAKSSPVGAGGAGSRVGGAVAAGSSIDYVPLAPSGPGAAVHKLQIGPAWAQQQHVKKSSSAMSPGAAPNSSSFRDLSSGSDLEKSLAAADALLQQAQYSHAAASDPRAPARVLSAASSSSSRAAPYGPLQGTKRHPSSGPGRGGAVNPSAGMSRTAASSQMMTQTHLPSSVAYDRAASSSDEQHNDGEGSSNGYVSPSRHAASKRTGTSWDGMNNIAAHVMTHLTASMRFEGPLNVDLNEITSTLVPFPRLNLLQASVTPLFALSDLAVQSSPRRITAMFNDAFTRGNQLIRGDPQSSVHLACGLLLRGDIALSDVQSNMEGLKRGLQLASWNPDGEQRRLFQSFR